MKRLITALAALAGAFGLQAASFSKTGTSFEPDVAPTEAEASTTNFVGDVTTQGELTPGNFWSLPELSDSVEVKLLVTNYNQTAAQTVPQIGAVSHYATLSISTGKDAEVERYAADGGAVVNLGEGESGSSSGVDGESLHFDSLVKFTAYDQAMDAGTVLGSDGKIAVWVYCDEDTDPDHPVTNLMVSAGFIDNGGSTVSPTNYICSVNLPNTPLCDTWHRVTIKAMRSMVKEDAEIYPGFAIAIDGNPVGTGEHVEDVSSDKGLGNLIDLNLSLNPVAGKLDVYGALFPSARRGIENANVKSVAFRGMGEVDDLVFTEDTCGIQDFEEQGSIAIRGGAGVAGFTYTLGGSSVSVVGNNTSITWAGDMTVTISDVQIANGSEYVFDNITVNGNTYSLNDAISGILDMATISINTTLGGAMVDGKAYATAAKAFDAINDLSEVPTDPITVTLLRDVAEGVELNADGVSVILDLAGKTIAADQDEGDAAIYFAAGNLVIIDSVGGGVVNGSQMEYPTALITDQTAGSLVISNGTFIGEVYAEDADPFEIAGGRFNMANNAIVHDPDDPEDPDYTWILADATLPEGYEFVEGTGDDAGYYVLQQIIEWTVTYLDEEDDTYEQTESVRDGQFATGPDPAPARDGYTLAGWETRTEGTPYDDDDDPETPDVTPVTTNTFDLATTPIDADITLYAKWEEASSGLDPASGVTEITVDNAGNADDAEDKAKESITVPTGASAYVQPEDYADYFLYGVTDNQDGTYTVAITGIVETVETGVAASAVKRLTDSEATAIAVPAGLYYRITPSAALPINGTPETGLSTTGSVNVTPVTSEDGSKGFFKVELSPTPTAFQ